MAARSALKAFSADERGATAIEYALLIAILGLGIISAAGVLSGQIYDVLHNVGVIMETAAGAAGG